MGDVGYVLFFYVFMLRKAAGRLLFNRNNITSNQKAPAGRLIKHRNMNTNNLKANRLEDNILNYNGQSSIDYINEVIEMNKRIVEELNAVYDSVRRF